MVVFRAAVLKNEALENNEKSPIHISDVIRMMRGSTLQRVSNESWSRYRGVVEKSDEWNGSDTNQK